MPILNIQTSQAGLTGVAPSIAYINTTDTDAQVLATGYLNQSVQSGLAAFSLPCMALVSTVNSAGAQPDVGWYEVSYTTSSGVPNIGNWSLTSSEFAAPAVFPDTTSLAAPGTIRALTGKMTGTATVMTSGNLVGVRGELDVVGASGGYLYGAQGKVIATGTLSGSSWTAGVFGQLNIAAATINAGQTATLWGDYGTSSGTLTSTTGMYGIAMTNTTAAVLAAQVYLYGGATDLLLLSTNTSGVGATYVATPTGSTPSGALRTLKINIDGTTYYILAAAVYSS